MMKIKIAPEVEVDLDEIRRQFDYKANPASAIGFVSLQPEDLANPIRFIGGSSVANVTEVIEDLSVEDSDHNRPILIYLILTHEFAYVVPGPNYGVEEKFPFWTKLVQRSVARDNLTPDEYYWKLYFTPQSLRLWNE